ncbi:PEP-CTERM-box response regulator transcription factor [Pelagicoccus albus]|uniref:PEP-CTERM-box response regulator transcription factor n=2 Tax=Pelagicoccus albus TaxID=415222 RepID=A0A7X1B9Z1_9BACT|nr:PEP-CTERM-box response regulator transcription factor [Pelagicoccus albus]
MRENLSSDYQILQAGNKEGALKALRRDHPEVVVLDLGLPPSPNLADQGIETLDEIKRRSPKTKVVIISGQGAQEAGPEAIEHGAYDFLTKPVDSVVLRNVLSRCFYIADLDRMTPPSPKKRNTVESYEGIIGECDQMRSLFKLTGKVAKTDAPVMILGESGTGKEMIAKAIHNRSAFAEGPFIPINCSAIPENLLESELFGHERGSFTGADQKKVGKIEQAQGGTLFLDEIGDVPLNVQVKLLRFLQEKYIERVGGTAQIPISTRILAATNVDLKKAISEGKFREDFYFRLAVVELEMPPLRERGQDVICLAKSFLDKYSVEAGNPKLKLSSEALTLIETYSWVGNVRELQNRIRRAAILAENDEIGPEDLQITPSENPVHCSTLKEAKENLERDMITAALKKHRKNITAAAADLGISRPTFYEMMDRLSIDR